MNGSPPEFEVPLCDLLEPEPRARVDLASLERAADFAFAAAGTFTEIDTCLGRAAPAPSTWEPGSFERALFVRELVERTFTIQIDGVTSKPDLGHLLGLLTRPPRDPATTRFRHDILRELIAHDDHRRALERCHVHIRNLRTLFGPPETHDLSTPPQRRMAILASVRRTFEFMASSFEGASSGLSRLRRTGEAALASAGFRRLIELLDLDQSLAVIDARLQIGGDGQLRSLAIVAVRENEGNRYHEPPLRRLWRRLDRLWRGFFYRDEDVRDAVVDEVFQGIKGPLARLFQVAGDLEFYLAALGFREQARARGLAVCLPSIDEGDGRRLLGLFNPHLLAGTPVPCDLSFEQAGGVVVITGPNSGGKTRLLQSVALAQMFAQVGTFVPAREARVRWAEGLFVSLIEEARHDQREGRLGSELQRIREVFEQLRAGGLVLLDELCSGTNPSEGQEIFELVVELLSQLSPQAFISTHFLDFAAHLAASPRDGMSFLQVELDERDEPTYQFIPGVARSSLAGKIAARLGVTRESLQALVERARRRG